MIGISDEMNRGVLSVSVLVVVVTLWVATGTVAAQSAPDCSAVTYNGEGTEASPYEVSNVDQLQCIESQGLDASYEIVSDIDASGTASWNDGKGFAPIGENSGISSGNKRLFNGTLNGQRYNITNLKIDRANKNGVGLFSGVGSRGMIKNVSVVNVDFTGSRGVGGLAGANSGTVHESYTSGLLNGSRFVGGLIGGNSGTVKHSYSSGLVNGTLGIAGLVGVNNGTVSESYASGSVNGVDTVGGFVGWNQGGTISEAYASASVNATSGAGALVGVTFRGSIVKSYASGSVNGSGEDMGGLVGFSLRGTVDESYWDIEATGQSSSAGGTGLTTGEMIGSAARGNMTGFNFTSTWETVNGDYPVLTWQTDDGGDGAESGTGNERLPGFTVVTAILALLTVAVAVRRRTK